MRAFYHEFIWKGIPVDILSPVPFSKDRDDILVPDGLTDVLLHLKLVHKTVIQRIPVIQLEPLKLFGECLGRIQIQPVPHKQPVLNLQIQSVGKNAPCRGSKYHQHL